MIVYHDCCGDLIPVFILWSILVVMLLFHSEKKTTFVEFFVWWYKYLLSRCLCFSLNKPWNCSSCTKLALSASWTRGLMAQLVRASEQNSVVMGSNLTQVNFLLLFQRIRQWWIQASAYEACDCTATPLHKPKTCARKTRCARKTMPGLIKKASRCAADCTSKTTCVIFHFL